jgi:hypothetical protein
MRRAVEFPVNAPVSLRVRLNQVQDCDGSAIDGSYFRLRNSFLMVVPVLPQEITEVTSPFCKAEVIESVWAAPLISRQIAVRFYVATAVVTVAHRD